MLNYEALLVVAGCFSEPSLSLYVSIGYPWSHCLQNHIQKKHMLMKSQHLKPYRCLVLLYRFRPTFDLPIPPIYQPSTIETVARDRSPRHSGEKWKFWLWKPPKKWWNHFQLCWNIYISIVKYIGGVHWRFFKNLQIPENKIFGRSVFWGEDSLNLKKLSICNTFWQEFHLMQKNKIDRSPVKIGIAGGGRFFHFFLWCHAINFHSPAFCSHSSPVVLEGKL